MGLSQERARIAVLDDDVDFCKLLRFHLRQDYHLLVAADGAELVRLREKKAVDAVVLDIGLPGEDGISIARRVRAMSDIPLVFLSGYASTDMVAKGLNIGGDDYIVKPFQAEVLLARIRNALRRGKERTPATPIKLMQLSFGDIGFDEREHLLTNASGYTVECVKLTEMESLILAALARARDQTLSRDELYLRIHGKAWDLMSRELEVHVSHLRRKLNQVGCAANPIVSLRGRGYRLSISQK